MKWEKGKGREEKGREERQVRKRKQRQGGKFSCVQNKKNYGSREEKRTTIITRKQRRNTNIESSFV